MKSLLIITTALISAVSFAQRPREVQLNDEPTDWSNPWTIIFCVIIPVFLILGGVYINKRRKKQ